MKMIFFLADLLSAPLVLLSSVLLKIVRRGGVANFPIARNIFIRVGILPVIDHYYEPLFNPKHLRYPLDRDRSLPGIRFEEQCQLALLANVDFGEELRDLSDEKKTPPQFHFNNDFFEPGDAEIWYGVIRRFKPRRIVEIGSGYSTILAARAVAANRADDQSYHCDHICIEPFEKPWLEKLGVKVLRKRVEEAPPEIFASLEAGDVLFIDSSHMIRPQGDVLYEYLEILPTLQKGVIVHIHDIFSPRDYPAGWVIRDMRLWNEQYLAEAFLSCTTEWEIMLALNFLHHHHYDSLKTACPHLTPDGEPGSLYIRKTG